MYDIQMLCLLSEFFTFSVSSVAVLSLSILPPFSPTSRSLLSLSSIFLSFAPRSPRQGFTNPLFLFPLSLSLSFSLSLSRSLSLTPSLSSSSLFFHSLFLFISFLSYRNVDKTYDDCRNNHLYTAELFG